jgi:subtilase family serine protease
MLTAMVGLGATSGHAQAQAQAQAHERENLPTQHVREDVRGLKPRSALPADKVLQFDMLLGLGEPRQLDQFLAEVYDPASPSYRRFVTPAEFTARFGPSQAAWNELVSFAKKHGFTVISGSRDEMDLRVRGTVHAIEAAFQVKMRVFDHPTESRTFYSPDVEPTIDMRSVVWHISGLDNFSTPRPRLHARPGAARSRTASKPLTATGACPDDSYCGSDMRSAYYGSNALTGAGQSIGLLEFYGYDGNDLATYFSNSGQTNQVPVNGISTDGTPVSCLYASGCDDTEQTIDMTQALGMAPGLAQLNVYVGSSDTALLSAMSVPAPNSVTGKVDAQLSCSWAWYPADPGTDDPLFKKFAAQGQSFFTAAGDSGAYTPTSTYVYPADDANVTVVGGSSLSTTGPGGAWLGETAWSDGGGGYFAADGIPIPAWQPTAISSFDARSSSPGSTTLRNSPDVAGEADFDFYVCANQQPCYGNALGGTSFAAPMWAGYMALANQQATQGGQPTLGFLNPALYALGTASGGSYAAAFHDITAGGNGYAAVTGYDLATGWGSPNGTGLITALLGLTRPAFTLSTSGPLALPSPGTGRLTLTSAVTGGFNSAITLTASGQPSGMTVSFSPASITGAGSSAVTFQIAANVPAGSYTVTLTGTGSAAPSARSVTTVSVTVTTPNFVLAANAALTVPAATTGSMTLTSTASGGFAAAIALSAVGQPTGVTVSFSPTSISGSGASTVRFEVAPTAAAGVFPIRVIGTSGSLTRVATVNLTVAVPTFSLAASVGSLTLTQGLSGRLTLSSNAAGGFASPVALTAAGQPRDVTVSFGPATINAGGTATVTVAVGAAATAGTYPLTLTGTSGALQRSVRTTLTVTAAGFAITPAAESVAVLQGASASVALSTAATGVLSGPISLSMSTAPKGIVATLSANSVVPPGTATLSLSAAETLAAGSYPIVFSGVGDNVTQKATVTLVVSSPAKPNFTFTVASTTLAVTHGTSTSFNVESAPAGTTVPVVALSVSGLPTGVTASFRPSTISGSGTSTVTLTAAAAANRGTATVTFSGTVGSNTQSSTVHLTVN